MKQIDRILDFYKKLYEDAFISGKGFQVFRFSNSEFYSCAATLRDTNGKTVTCSINIDDENPDVVELLIQVMNNASFEQLKVVGSHLSECFNRKIDVYNEMNNIAMACEFGFDESEIMLDMMKKALDSISKVIIIRL